MLILLILFTTNTNCYFKRKNAKEKSNLTMGVVKVILFIFVKKLSNNVAIVVEKL